MKRGNRAVKRSFRAPYDEIPDDLVRQDNSCASDHSLEHWSAREWSPKRAGALPKGYLVTNLLSQDGAEEIVGWAPQRVKAERFAKLPELEELAFRGENLAVALLRMQQDSGLELPSEIEELLAEVIRLRR